MKSHTNCHEIKKALSDHIINKLLDIIRASTPWESFIDLNELTDRSPGSNMFGVSEAIDYRLRILGVRQISAWDLIKNISIKDISYIAGVS